MLRAQIKDAITIRRYEVMLIPFVDSIGDDCYDSGAELGYRLRITVMKAGQEHTSSTGLRCNDSSHPKRELGSIHKHTAPRAKKHNFFSVQWDILWRTPKRRGVPHKSSPSSPSVSLWRLRSRRTAAMVSTQRPQSDLASGSILIIEIVPVLFLQ
jgi:hypothetical protein